MTFHDVRFPADISFGSSGGPEYSTNVIVMDNGFEQRNINWSSARSRYNVSHGVKSQSQLDALIAFFRARKGRAYVFRFKDWTDYKAIAVQIGTGNGLNTQFQLIKTYSSGGYSESRIITKPVSGTVKIYLGGVLQSSGYTINYLSGLITFSSAITNGVVISADFEFDVPVRFDTDRLSTSLENYGVAGIHDIAVLEVK